MLPTASLWPPPTNCHSERERKFLNGGRLLDLAVGGWSLNTFGIIQSGFPLSVTQANSNSVIGASYMRPNATGVPAATSGSTDSRISDWLNLAAFSVAPELSFGDVSRFLTFGAPAFSTSTFPC
jgi:trimeric autotransporter adhesin